MLVPELDLVLEKVTEMVLETVTELVVLEVLISKSMTSKNIHQNEPLKQLHEQRLESLICLGVLMLKLSK
jgi:L-lactate utilization protein LutB